MAPRHHKSASKPSRRLTLREQALAEEIIKAWTDPGPSPMFHERRKSAVRAQMPALGERLDVLAQERREW